MKASVLLVFVVLATATVVSGFPALYDTMLLSNMLNPRGRGAGGILNNPLAAMYLMDAGEMAGRGMNDFQEAMLFLNLINRRRAAGGAGPMPTG